MVGFLFAVNWSCTAKEQHFVWLGAIQSFSHASPRIPEKNILKKSKINLEYKKIRCIFVS